MIVLQNIVFLHFTFLHKNVKRGVIEIKLGEFEDAKEVVRDTRVFLLGVSITPLSTTWGILMMFCHFIIYEVGSVNKEVDN